VKLVLIRNPLEKNKKKINGLRPLWETPDMYEALEKKVNGETRINQIASLFFSFKVRATGEIIYEKKRELRYRSDMMPYNISAVAAYIAGF